MSGCIVKVFSPLVTFYYINTDFSVFLFKYFDVVRLHLIFFCASKTNFKSFVSLQATEIRMKATHQIILMKAAERKL